MSTSGGEMGGVELVCRLVAATPPFLYTPAGPPHCFFFSELLRSLVAKRTAAAQCPVTPGPSQSVKRLRLSSNGSAFTAHHGSSSERQPKGQPSNPLSPTSVLPRLKEIYTNCKPGEEPKKKGPLPAVLGLEIVVDYVKQEKDPQKP